MKKRRRPSPPAAAAPAPARAPVFAPSARLRVAAVVAGLVVICAIGFAARVVPAFRVVFPDAGGVTLLEPDAYYHTRHAAFAASHGLRIQRWDPALYPTGDRALYAGLFDLAIAAGARVASGFAAPSLSQVEEVAAWLPPLLGVAGFLGLFLLGRRAAGNLAGLAAAGLALLYPGGFLDRALLGAADHHCAEMALAPFVALGVCRALAPSAAPWWRPALLAALPFALLLFTWYGAPIYLVLIALALFVAGSLALWRDGAAPELARGAARWAAGVIALAAPVGLIFPSLRMEPRMLAAALLATAALGGGLAGYLLGGARLIRRGVPRAAVVLGTAAALAVVAWLAARALPFAARLARDLLGVKNAIVKEQQAATLDEIWRTHGTVAILAALALPAALVAAARRRDGGPAALVAAGIGTAMCALWLRTHDYDYAAATFLPALAAIAVASVARTLRAERALVAVAAVAVVAPLLGPLRLRQARAADLEAQLGFRPGVVAACRWLRDRAPPLARPLAAPVDDHARHPAGNYGVLAFWDLGHYVAALGERPTNATGALTTSAARVFVATDEERALAEARAGLQPGERFRYLLADVRLAAEVWQPAVQMTGGAPTPPATFETVTVEGRRVPLVGYDDSYRRSLAARLVLDGGDDLAHLRLVYASPGHHAVAYVANLSGSAPKYDRRSFRVSSPDKLATWRRMAAGGRPARDGASLLYGVSVTPSAKLFEQVAGAHLVGNAAPGAEVEARLELSLADAGESFTYHRRGRADAAGRYELIVPYATFAEPGADVAPRGAYSIVSAGRTLATAHVPASAVDAGATIMVH